MNKKLIALAVAAAAAAPAALANEVVLYGQANVAATVKNFGANKNSVSIDSQSSRIGLKGDENLGSGLSAWFQMEQEVALDNSANSKPFASREGWVGVKSKEWGGVALGRGKSAFTRAYEEFDPFYQDDASASMGFGHQGYTGSATVPNMQDGGYAYRTNNTVRYSYTVEGLDIAVDYATMEDKAAGSNEGRDISAYVKSTIGNFWVVSGLNMGRNLTLSIDADGAVKRGTAKTGETAIAGTGKLNNSFLGAGTSFGDFSVSAAWQRHNYSNSAFGTNKRDTLILAASTALGDASLYGNVHMADKLKYSGKKLAGSNFTKFGVGLAVPLSKRTNIVTELVGVDFGGSEKSSNSFSTGIYHAF